MSSSGQSLEGTCWTSRKELWEDFLSASPCELKSSHPPFLHRRSGRSCRWCSWPPWAGWCPGWSRWLLQQRWQRAPEGSCRRACGSDERAECGDCDQRQLHSLKSNLGRAKRAPKWPTSLPVNLQGDKTGTASPSYSKETPLKWDLAKPTSSSWFTPGEGTNEPKGLTFAGKPTCILRRCFRQETAHLQQQPAPYVGLCSGCWCSPQDSDESESWKQGKTIFNYIVIIYKTFHGCGLYSNVRICLMLPGIVGWSQHTLTQRCALESCGMQQVQTDFLEVAIDFLQLTQQNAPLLLDLSLVQGAALNHFCQQLHGWKSKRGT